MVPIPSWLTKTRESVTDDPQKLSMELSIIYKYSPFKTEAELMQQFDVIYGKCGKIIKTLKFQWKYLFSVSYERHYVIVFIFFSIYNVPGNLTWGQLFYFIHISFCIKRIQTYITVNLSHWEKGLYLHKLGENGWEEDETSYNHRGSTVPVPDSKIRGCLFTVSKVRWSQVYKSWLFTK